MKPEKKRKEANKGKWVGGGGVDRFTNRPTLISHHGRDGGLKQGCQKVLVRSY